LTQLGRLFHPDQVLFESEGLPLVGPDDFIEAVTVQEAPIEYRDFGIGGVKKFTVQIDQGAAVFHGLILSGLVRKLRGL
jgi:hypothetical protein